MKKRIIIIVILVIITIIVLLFIKKNENGESTLISFINNLEQFEYYPDTTEAPVLELTWDGELDPNTVTRYGPYGEWEGEFETPKGLAYEPANEMQFYLDTFTTNTTNFLAVAPGIVTQNQTFDNGVGLVSVQYGQNYVITYMHIIPREDLEIKQQVATGDFLGTMEKKTYPTGEEEIWWEIMLSTYSDGKYRTLPPYDYFSDEGKAKFDAIAYAVKDNNMGYFDEEGNPLWTIREGCSWMKYVDDESWWDSGRFMDHYSGDSQKEFIDSLGMGWIIGDDSGRIIGPTDDCN